MNSSSKFLIFSLLLVIFFVYLFYNLHTVKCTDLKCIIWWVLTNARNLLLYQYIEHKCSTTSPPEASTTLISSQLFQQHVCLLELLVSKTVEYVLICVWHFSLTAMFLRFIHAVPCMSSFLFLSNILLQECTTFVYQFTCWHLGYLPTWRSWTRLLWSFLNKSFYGRTLW